MKTLVAILVLLLSFNTFAEPPQGRAKSDQASELTPEQEDEMARQIGHQIIKQLGLNHNFFGQMPTQDESETDGLEGLTDEQRKELEIIMDALIAVPSEKKDESSGVGSSVMDYQ